GAGRPAPPAGRGVLHQPADPFRYHDREVPQSALLAAPGPTAPSVLPVDVLRVELSVPALSGLRQSAERDPEHADDARRADVPAADRRRLSHHPPPPPVGDGLKLTPSAPGWPCPRGSTGPDSRFAGS